MNACKRLRFASSLTSLLGALAISACTIVPSDDPGDANAQVEKVVVVGTSVTSALYADGKLALTTVPTDAAGEAVLAKGLEVHVSITSPIALDVTVDSTECTEPDQGKKSISVGVILDDSGSMDSSDPDNLRRSATVSFLKALGADDRVLLTDYGNTYDDRLRDLLCVADARTKTGTTGTDPLEACSPPKPAFTSDKSALIRATEEIVSGGGTPLYEACAEMVPLVDSVKDGRRGMLLLSDGLPNDESAAKRDACHGAAKAAGIPVFTVGLGPAAEGDQGVDPAAVKVLRELATETGGSYASANDASQLDNLFRNMGTALARGSCKTSARIARVAEIQPGASVKGEVRVGTKGAKASFDFVAPAR
jgi:hypothetical protein